MRSYNMPKNAPCKAEFGVSAATADISCYVLSLLQVIEKKISVLSNWVFQENGLMHEVTSSQK